MCLIKLSLSYSYPYLEEYGRDHEDHQEKPPTVIVKDYRLYCFKNKVIPKMCLLGKKKKTWSKVDDFCRARV